MKLSPIDRRLAASWHQRQIEIVAKADAIASALGQRIDAARGRILAAIQSGGPTRGVYERIRRIYAGIIPDAILWLDDYMRRMVRYSDRDAKDRLADLVPRGWWRLLYPAMRESIQEAAPRNRDAFARLFGPGAFVASAEPALRGRGKMSDAEYKALVRKTILPPLSEPEVERIVKSPNPHTGESWQERLRGLSGKIKTPEALAGEIITGMANGENVNELRNRVDEQVGKLHGSSMRIARTEARRIAEKANRESWASLGDLLDGAQIMAVLDERTRTHHAARHGTIYRKGGVPEFSELPDLPDAPNCVLPGNLVSGQFVGALKARYSGPAVKIQAANGCRVSVTSNHPILTSRGFVPACKIKKGDHLACHVGKEKLSPEVEDKQQSPAFVEDVFRAFDILFGFAVKRSSSLNLHGDAQFTDGNIHVVNSDLLLLGNLNADRAEHGGESVFAWAGMAEPSMAGSGPSELSFDGVDVSAAPVVGSDDLLPSATPAHLGPFDSFGFGSGSNWSSSGSNLASNCGASDAQLVGKGLKGSPVLVGLDRVIDSRDFDCFCAADGNTGGHEFSPQGLVFKPNLSGERPEGFASAVSLDDLIERIDGLGAGSPCRIGPAADCDPALGKPAGECFQSDMRLVGELRQRFSGEVAFSDVVHCETFHYEGDVFDLQSTTGWYFAGEDKASIGISNCRCTAVPVLKTPSEVINDPKVAAAFATDKNQHIPDPSAYEQWFRTSDEPRQRLAVGSRRYDVIAKRKAPTGERPEWRDFIGTDGSLLPVTKLKRESITAAAERAVEVGAMLLQRNNLFRQIASSPFTLGVQTFDIAAISAAQRAVVKSVVRKIAAGKLADPVMQIAALRGAFPNATDDTLRRLLAEALAAAGDNVLSAGATAATAAATTPREI